MGVRAVGRVRDGFPQRRHIDRRIRGKRGQRLLDHRRLDERFVPLDVDQHVTVERGGHFSHAIGAGPVRGTGHPRDAAEPLDRGHDTRVIGGDNHGIDASGLRGTAIDMLDHRATIDVGEGFSGKSCGVETGGDNGDDARGLRRSFERISERGRGHGES